MSTSKLHIREPAAIAAANNLLPAVIEQTAIAVFERFNKRLKAGLNGRQDRGLELALKGHVTHKAKRIFSVRSEKGEHAYLVDLDRKYCSCPDSRSGHACKHRIAAYLIEQAKAANLTIVPETETLSQVSEPKDYSPSKDALERARFVLHRARSDALRQAIVYAAILHNDEPQPIEVVSIEGEVALVRALPDFKDGKVTPQFPFEGRNASARVLAECLFDIRIYR